MSERKNVICKDNEGFEDQLTKGEHYAVIMQKNDSVYVKTDRKTFGWYGMAKFTEA